MLKELDNIDLFDLDQYLHYNDYDGEPTEEEM
jgi:hypothetical protein